MFLEEVKDTLPEVSQRSKDVKKKAGDNKYAMLNESGTILHAH